MTQSPIDRHHQPGSGPSLRRWSVLIALGCGAVLLWALLASKSLHTWWSDRAVVAIGEQSYELTPRDWRAAFERAVAARVAAEGTVMNALEEDIDALVAQAFALPRGQVTEVGDWYYSLAGTGTRSLASLADLWGHEGAAIMGQHISERLFPPDQWQPTHTALIDTLLARATVGTVDSLERMQSVLYRELSDYTLTNDAGTPSARAAPDWQLNSQVLEVLAEDSVLVASLAGTSLTALGSLATLRVMAQRRAAMTAAARLAGRGTTLQGGTACLASGPWAAVCASGVVAGTVVATEWGILKMDELAHREAFETALRQDIDRMEAQFRIALHTTLVTGLAEAFEARSASITTQFRPIDAVFGTQ